MGLQSGIHGTVLSAATGKPVAATVHVDGLSKTVLSTSSSFRFRVCMLMWHVSVMPSASGRCQGPIR